MGKMAFIDDEDVAVVSCCGMSQALSIWTRAGRRSTRMDFSSVS